MYACLECVDEQYRIDFVSRARRTAARACTVARGMRDLQRDRRKEGNVALDLKSVIIDWKIILENERDTIQ